MRKFILDILLIIILSAMLLPLAQDMFSYADNGKLDGHIVNAADTVFTLKGWWDGRWQEQKTAYLNDNMGLRPWLVRINNEADHVLLNRLHARQLVEGKERYLYEQPYIDSYCGKDTVTYKTIAGQMYKLKRIQDTLERMGVAFIYVIAPSKARFFPEYFPEDYHCPNPAGSSYFKFLSAIDSLDIKTIDFNKWFVAIRDTSQHLLMTKQGVHWTKYGASLASDSLTRYIERVKGIKMRHLIRLNVRKTTEAPGEEKDMATSLNLLSTYAVESFTDFDIAYSGDSSADRPDVIYNGDSFILTYRNYWYPDNVNDDWEVWYYLHDIWKKEAFSGKKPVINISEYDWAKALSETDVFIMQYSEPVLSTFGHGFIDMAYEHYYGK